MDEAEIRAVIAKLKAADWDAEVIDDDLSAMIRSPEIIQALADPRNSKDDVMRSDTDWILAKIQAIYARQFTKLLDARTSAHKKLLNETDITGLIVKLKDAEPRIRQSAAEELGNLGNPAAVPYLIEALGDAKEIVREYSIYALREIADEHDIPDLEPLLKNENVHLRIAAAYALGAKGGKDAVRGLIDLVRVGITGSKPEYERARDELQLIGQPSVDELIEVLDERDDVLSQLAIDVLAPIGDVRALPHIIAAMGDENDQVYEAATWGAGEFGEAAIPLLMAALKDKNPRLRANAAQALVKIPFIDITDNMIALLKDSDAAVRRVALFALENIADLDTVKYILPLLRGPAQDAQNLRTSASYAAQVLRGRLSTPEGLAAVERWRREEAGKGI